MSPVSDGVGGFDEQAKSGFYRIGRKFRFWLVAWIGRKPPVAAADPGPAAVPEASGFNDSSGRLPALHP
jgi:hypothetical protein